MEKTERISHSFSFQNWLLLIALTLIWGTSYILIKKSLTVFSPPQTAALRIVFSFLVSSPFLYKAVKSIPRKQYPSVLLVGLLGSGIPAFLFSFSMLKINSAVNGIINSLSPLFTVLTGYLFWNIFTPRFKMIGVLIGFAGALVLIFGKGTFSFDGEISYALLPIVATFCYGTNSNLVKQKFPQSNPILITSLAMAMLGLPCFLFLLSTPFEICMQHPDFYKITACVFFLSLFGTVIGWILYYKLVQNTDALFAASVTYLIPIVAIFWGLLDGEKIAYYHFIGMGLILIGVYFVSRYTTTATK